MDADIMGKKEIKRGQDFKKSSGMLRKGKKRRGEKTKEVNKGEETKKKDKRKGR